MTDPQFLAQATKMKLTVNPMGGATIEKTVADIYAAPAGLVGDARDASPRITAENGIG